MCIVDTNKKKIRKMSTGKQNQSKMFAALKLKTQTNQFQASVRVNVNKVANKFDLYATNVS